MLKALFEHWPSSSALRQQSKQTEQLQQKLTTGPELALSLYLSLSQLSSCILIFPTADPLTAQQFLQLLEKVSDWWSLGVALHIPEAKLEEIKSEKGEDSTACKEDIFKVC